MYLAHKLVSASLAVMLSSTAMAQTERQPAAPNPDNTADDADDNVIIVTATKRQAKIQDVPQAITAVSGEDLERMSASNFADYARAIPGVAFVDYGTGRQKVSIRGISVTGGSPTVGYYINDAPIPSTAGTIRLTNIDPSVVDIDRIEILRGPQGTLFGAGAMGGVIRFIPKQPDPNEFSGRAEIIGTAIDGGGFGFEGRGVVNVPLMADLLAVRFATWHRDQDGFIDRRWGDNLSLPDPSRRIANVSRNEPHENTTGGRAAMLFRVTDDIDLEASLFHQTQDFSGFQQVIGGPGNPGEKLVQNQYGDVPETQLNKFTLGNITARGTHDWLSWTLTASRSKGVQQSTEDGTAASLYFYQDLIGVLLSPIDEGNVFRDTSFEARVASARPIHNLDFVLGAFYEKTKRVRTVSWVTPGIVSRAFGPVPGGILFRSDVPARFQNRFKALFAEVNYELFGGVTLTGGVRRDWISGSSAASSISGFEGGGFTIPIAADPGREIAHTSKKFSGAWRINDDVMIYGTRSEGYRPGSLSSRGVVLTPVCEAQAKAAGFDVRGLVRPDSVVNYEVGLKSQPARGVRFNASAYNINWTDIQQTAFLPCGFRIAANAGDARSRGIEGELSARVSPKLLLGFAGMVGSAKITNPSLGRALKGDRIQQSPNWTASAYAELEMPPIGDVQSFFRVDVQAVGSSFNDFVKGLPPKARAEQKLGALSLVNGRLWTDYHDWRVAAFVQNILNDIEHIGYQEALAVNIPDRPRFSVNRPRTFGISVSRNF